MGVLDVLPHAVSSKYFFWDSQYAPLALGKYSALKEAEWVQGAAQHCPALHYYYMGFYVHSCHKMRYKAEYHPSDLLCPERLCWVPFDRIKAALDVSHFPICLHGNASMACSAVLHESWVCLLSYNQTCGGQPMLLCTEAACLQCGSLHQYHSVTCHVCCQSMIAAVLQVTMGHDGQPHGQLSLSSAHHAFAFRSS